MQREYRFDLFRLSLRQREQVDILDKIEPKSREEWIRTLFSNRTEFRHHGVDFVYIPLNPEVTYPMVVGKIGRETSEIENTSPEDGYQEFVHETWKAAVVVVDPTEHEDGQKLAVQFHADVGKPSSLAPRLLQAMEGQQEYRPYLSSVHPITNKEAFWDFVKRNEGKITYIRFELEVPNMFGGDDEFDKEMKEYRDKEKAQKVAIEITSPDGVDAETDRVRYTAGKAMTQGTGNIKARAVGKGNNFLEQFVNHNFLSFMGIFVTITLASTASIHIELRRKEECAKEEFLPKTRAAVRKSAISLILALFLSLIVVVVKPLLPSTEIWSSLANSFALSVILWSFLVVWDITKLAFKI